MHDRSTEGLKSRRAAACTSSQASLGGRIPIHLQVPLPPRGPGGSLAILSLKSRTAIAIPESVCASPDVSTPPRNPLAAPTNRLRSSNPLRTPITELLTRKEFAALGLASFAPTFRSDLPQRPTPTTPIARARAGPPSAARPTCKRFRAQNSLRKYTTYGPRCITHAKKKASRRWRLRREFGLGRLWGWNGVNRDVPLTRLAHPSPAVLEKPF